MVHPSIVQTATCTAEWWLELAGKILNKKSMRNRDFQAHFGVSPFIVSVVWYSLCIHFVNVKVCQRGFYTSIFYGRCVG